MFGRDNKLRDRIIEARKSELESTEKYIAQYQYSVVTYLIVKKIAKSLGVDISDIIKGYERTEREHYENRGLDFEEELERRYKEKYG